MFLIYVVVLLVFFYLLYVTCMSVYVSVQSRLVLHKYLTFYLPE